MRIAGGKTRRVAAFRLTRGAHSPARFASTRVTSRPPAAEPFSWTRSENSRCNRAGQDPPRAAEKTVGRLGSDKSIAVDVRVIACHEPRPAGQCGGRPVPRRSLLSSRDRRHPAPAAPRAPGRPDAAHRPLPRRREPQVRRPARRRTEDLESPPARNLLLRHPWPGNVRELQATIDRLVLWAPGATVAAEDVREECCSRRLATSQPICSVGASANGLELPTLVADLARHYLERALAEANGNKTQAAEFDRPGKLYPAPTFRAGQISFRRVASRHGAPEPDTTDPSCA